ncbi:hypothetical protein MML48_1g08606 [Holotrichia oblita]|uniref:Uncharacterized protein n=1 Tax=Holotrichia oblita TaxID=644536 RepID=A0ACB9TZA1_HOLOL|nr:hypothetical protein MML48_1g08606 [Holotrichia oblita]
MKKELMDNAHAAAIVFTQEHGWMDKDVFVKWLQHLVKDVKPSEQEKILLMLDDHMSHKNLEAQEFAKANGIILFCFPPHCTHRVQPLDVALFGSLTTYHNQELLKWLKSHPGRTITHYRVAELFKNAYQNAATISNAEKGFLSTGIYPFNPDIFPDWMFAPAEIPSVSSYYIPITNLSPIPKASTGERQKSARTRGKAGVLNSTPEIAALKEKVLQKDEAQRRKSVRKIKKRLEVIKEDRENRDKEEEEEEELMIETDEEDDAASIFCNDLFSRSTKNDWWLRCQACQKWAHCECTGLPRYAKTFVCDLCV